MRRYWKYLKLFVIAGILFAMCGTAFSQFPKLPKIPKVVPDKIPGLDKILKKESPITNKLSDAVTEVPFLDDFNPKGKIPMTVLPRTKEGGFVLEEPGAYVFVCQSYCLHAGTYEPGKGDGYLYAPIKGPESDIFRHIVQNSVEHPEIPQRDIQVLLWAILARTKIADMSDELQLAAAKLLSPKEIFEINGGALELVPKSVLDKATIDMPPQVRKIVQAEANLREKLAQGEENYEELERIAVLHGVPPIGEGSRNVPRGRWSYKPGGFFVRYFPSGYQRTQIELYVPEPLNVERDGKGRITLISDNFENRIETEYDDSVEPQTIPGESSLKAYAFNSIRFERNDPKNPEKKIHIEWKKTGWTFCGEITGKGKIASSPDRFPGLKQRYEWAKKHKKELDNLDKQFSPTGSADDVTDSGNYAMGLRNATHSYLSTEENWKDYNPINLVKKQWQYAVSKREGGYLWSSLSPKISPSTMFSSNGSLLFLFAAGNPGGKPEYDPASDVAQPGNTSSQRLKQSGRPTGCWEDAEKRLFDAIDKCFSENSMVGKGKCEKSVIRCWWNRVTWYGGTKRDICISRDCKREGGTGVSPGSKLSNCINNAINDFKFEIESCLLGP